MIQLLICIPLEPGYILTKFPICYSAEYLRNMPVNSQLLLSILYY